MRARSPKPAGYEDVLALPDTVVGQVIGGELYVSPRPASDHGLAAAVLGSKLVQGFGRGGGGGPGGWHLLPEPELHLAADILVPDLAGWRVARMPRMTRQPFFTLAPDWVCEILSPPTARADRVHKMPVYAREGVRHLGLVDPVAHTLEIYRLEAGSWLVVGTHGGGDRVRAEPFDAIELELEALWLEDDEPAPPATGGEAPTAP
jgi:Uma2 family endonuclease